VAAWVDPGCDQHEVVEDEQGIEAGRRPQPEACHAEVLVHQQQYQPQSDHEALLRQECPIANTENPGHEGVGLDTATLQPEQSEERIEDIEDEDEDQQRHVAALEDVDVDVLLFAGAASVPPAPCAREGAPDRRRLPTAVGVGTALHAEPSDRRALLGAVPGSGFPLAGVLRLALLQDGSLRAARLQPTP
jgi:hypothetical protein